MNPVQSKIQKVKRSFRPDRMATADSTITSFQNLQDSSSLTNSRSQYPVATRRTHTSPSQEQQNHPEHGLLQRLLVVQDKAERQERSMNFYLRELNRREMAHQEHINRLETRYEERVECIQGLLRMEVQKNIRLEEELAGQVNDKENRNFSKATIKKMTTNELSDLINQVQQEVERRKLFRTSPDLRSFLKTPLRSTPTNQKQDSNLLSESCYSCNNN